MRDLGGMAIGGSKLSDQCLARITKAWTRGNARSAWYARFGKNGDWGIETKRSVPGTNYQGMDSGEREVCVVCEIREEWRLGDRN